MNDAEILALYWERNENAIKETDAVYGRRLHGTIQKRNVVTLMKWVSVAACLCLLLLGAYNLYGIVGQGTNTENPSEDLPGGAVAVETIPAAGGQPESDLQAPAQAPTGEVPSVILRVDGITENGFVGTVTQLVDTDVFEVGMELKVVQNH